MLPNFTLLFAAIHCVWDEWTPGPCSKTCGTGIQINTRTKLVVERDGGTCTGPDFEEKECKIIECPGNYYRKNVMAREFY